MFSTCCRLAAKKKLLDHYHSEFRGIQAHQDFKVIKAWELDAKEILRERNLALLPFMPLMAGADESVIRAGIEILREYPAGENLETVLALFASFVMDIETIQQLVRWNMAVLRESPWYKEILEEGIQQGLERGIEQGLERGLEQGLLKARREDILNILRVRFGLLEVAEAELIKRLAKIESSAVLQELVIDATRVDSLTAFNEVLDQKLADLDRSELEDNKNRN